MAKKRFAAVAVPVSVATGAAQDVKDLTSAEIMIDAIGSGTYHIEVSYDAGTSWVQLGADVTAETARALPAAAMRVRVRCSVYASGTPTGAVAGVTL